MLKYSDPLLRSPTLFYHPCRDPIYGRNYIRYFVSPFTGCTQLHAVDTRKQPSGVLVGQSTGLVIRQKESTFERGNSNAGHEFSDSPKGNRVIGRKLPPEERMEIIECLKTL